MFGTTLQRRARRSNGRKLLGLPVSVSIHLLILFGIIGASSLNVMPVEPPVKIIPWFVVPPDLLPPSDEQTDGTEPVPVSLVAPLPPKGKDERSDQAAEDLEIEAEPEPPPEPDPEPAPSTEPPVQPETIPEEPPEVNDRPLSADAGHPDGSDRGIPGGIEEGHEEGKLGGGPDGHPDGVRDGHPDGRLGPLGEPRRITPDMRPPERIHYVKPQYTDMARRAGIEGLVILRAVIDTDGTVKVVEVIMSLPLLDKAAIRAVERWRYRPAVQHGRPVKVYMEILVDFSLR
jgi:protein TonB